MSKPENELQPFNFETLCAADRAAGKSFILIDVGRNSKGYEVASLQRLQQKVEKCLSTSKRPVSTVTKLYIKGKWNTAKPEEDQTDKQKILFDAQEWKAGVDAIRVLIRAMDRLKELVWVSSLPFMPAVFADLPTKLTKLVLDLGNDVRVADNTVSLVALHITPEDMEPLVKQTRLQELRLLRLRDSLQFIAWKTVYRNQLPEGMRTLELQMDAEPILRNGISKWHRAVDVHGLTVAQPRPLEKPYKGRDGKGGLHWTFGYGEYLDGNCIRNARIASGIEEPLPLPLHTLKLDGFVIDHLPFEHELRDITLLTCGKKCIDAGMRAPKTQAEPYYAWSKKVNNAACRFLLQWPNWTGIFDTAGDQRNTNGEVVAQEAGLSTPYAPTLSQPMPLTEKTLSMKGISEAFDEVSKVDYFNIPPAPPCASAPDTPVSGASDLSEGGPRVSTPTRLSVTTTIEVVTLDGSVTSGSTSMDSSSILHINGASDPTPEMSPTSSSWDNSFGSDNLPREHEPGMSLTDSYWVLGPS